MINMVWLNDDWEYRKSHMIHGSVEDASTNYQVRIKVHYGSGVDSVDDVYCNSHCKTDFGDIRFTKSDGVTELSYFIEEKIDSDYAYIWIKITDNLYNADSNIYIYYGNAGVSTTSDGVNTFILFDDFENWAAGVPVGWTVSGTWSYEAGCAKCTGSGSLVRALTHTNVAMLSRGKVSANNSNYYGLTHYLRSNVNLEGALRASWWHHDYYTPHLQKTLDVWWYTAGYQSGHSTASAFDVNIFYIFNFGIFNVPNSGQLADMVYEFNHDSKTFYARTIGGYPCLVQLTGSHIGVTVFTCSPTYPAYFDWIAIRSFVYPEPTNDVWGIEEFNGKYTSPICTDPIFKLYIDENDPPTTERDYINIHYTKSHPNQDPDTFEIIVDPSVGVLINYFDRVKITKYDVNEFYGFVEEITPTVGEDGLEYRLTGRCWKLVLWKKWTERYQESREIGPVDTEGNIESGFFGQVKPEELIKFILRCPISEHPKGKVRQKIGWGIASDFWSCCASATADMFYPDWVGLRYTGLSWRGYASTETLHYSNLVCNAFDSTYLGWTEVGASPYLHTDSTADQIKTGTPPWGQKEGLFGFADLGGTAETIYTVKLYVKAMVQGYSAKISVHLYDGVFTYNIGYLNASPYGYGYTEFNCIAILDTPTKVNNAKIYFEMETGYHALVGVIYAYLHVEYSTTTDADINQKTDDWFVVNLGAAHDDVTAILIECRNNSLMYARNYKIQYCTISNCCVEGGNDGFWFDFDPVINETNNDVRDILHSWKPQDDIFGIRIKLTADAIYPWEISQIYIWQSDAYKYRVLNEGD